MYVTEWLSGFKGLICEASGTEQILQRCYFVVIMSVCVFNVSPAPFLNVPRISGL